MSDFKIYNRCLIPNIAPNDVPNVSIIDEEIKKNNCLFARWTTDFDCGYETDWYYVIKDNNWDISKLKSKDRNVVTKGLKNYNCSIIDPNKYKDDIYEIYQQMNQILPENSRSNLSKDKYCVFNDDETYIGAFDKENSKLSGYAIIKKYKSKSFAVNFDVLRYLPEARNKNINAAIIDFILNFYINEKKVDFVCDGERSIRHDTTFQDYLIRYFDFRKAYCKLNIRYNNKLKIIVPIIYPFRKIIKLFSNNRLFHNIYGVLLMEEIVRKIKKDGEKNV